MPAYVISIANSPRLVPFIERFNMTGTPLHLRIFDAIVPPKGITGLSAPLQRRGGAFGCHLSHLAILSAVKAEGASSTLVMEDDAVFCDDFWKKLFPAMGELPEDWDIMFAGSFALFNPEQVTANLWKAAEAHGTHCYVANGRSIPRILEVLRRFDTTVDNALTEVENGLHCYYVQPNLAWQADGESFVDGQMHTYRKEAHIRRK